MTTSDSCPYLQTERREEWNSQKTYVPQKQKKRVQEKQESTAQMNTNNNKVLHKLFSFIQNKSSSMKLSRIAQQKNSLKNIKNKTLQNNIKTIQSITQRVSSLQKRTNIKKGYLLSSLRTLGVLQSNVPNDQNESDNKSVKQQGNNRVFDDDLKKVRHSPQHDLKVKKYKIDSNLQQISFSEQQRDYIKQVRKLEDVLDVNLFDCTQHSKDISSDLQVKSDKLPAKYSDIQIRSELIPLKKALDFSNKSEQKGNFYFKSKLQGNSQQTVKQSKSFQSLMDKIKDTVEQKMMMRSHSYSKNTTQRSDIERVHPVCRSNNLNNPSENSFEKGDKTREIQSINRRLLEQKDKAQFVVPKNQFQYHYRDQYYELIQKDSHIISSNVQIDKVTPKNLEYYSQLRQSLQQQKNMVPDSSRKRSTGIFCLPSNFHNIYPKIQHHKTEPSQNI